MAGDDSIQPFYGSTSYVHRVGEELTGVVVFIAAIWGVFLLEYVTPIDAWGLVPRRVTGLVGIVTMTFLHGGWGHLLGNTVPLFVLLTLLAGSRERSWLVTLLIIVIGGSLLWVFGRTANHQGASLLIFGLITFLISSGAYFERRPATVLTALVVGLLYGTTLLFGVLPKFGTASQVSWDGHLCGAIAGVIVASLLATRRSSLPLATTLD
ncbi:MAG: rhomboid family intramembrane serine protease [Planctomycetales bacterium]|nr:rhomboid family intramembrane serine protease [Planctomycetales bacterium]